MNDVVQNESGEGLGTHEVLAESLRSKEWGDGIREIKFFGKIGREGEKRMQSMVDILQVFT